MRTPGLVDLQVNGFAGVDFNDADLTPAAFTRALEAMLATGVTACLPTIITASPEELMARFTALDAAVAGSPLGDVMVPGYHLEGPFLNPNDGFAGCHPAAVMTPPAVALVERIQATLKKPILLITLAPEQPGSAEFIRWAAEHDIVIAIGHSAASFTEVTAAADAGATLATHLGNGVLHQQHKFANPIMAQLAEDRLVASFIADGIHIPPAVLKVMLRAKGPGRSILVTDAVAGAAAPTGTYDFAGMKVNRVPDGSMRLPGEGAYLAGSSLTMDQAVRNLVAWGIASFEEAVALASDAPRRLMAQALAARGIQLATGSVDWTDDLHIRTAQAA